MDGRTSGLLAAALLFGCVGCVTTTTEKGLHEGPPPPEKPAARTADGKRAPSPGLTLEFARMRRQQADAMKDNPEKQARLRDEARLAYQETLKNDPNNLEALRSLGLLYVQMNDYERAFDTYRKAQAKHPKSAGLWLDLATVHNRRKDWAESAKCCRKALELEPENRQALNTLGLTLARAGKYDEALPNLTRASGSAVAHYNVARMQLHNGQKDQARQSLAVALRENPNLPSAQDLLASLDAGTPNNSGIVQTRGTASLQPPAQ